MSFAPEQVFLEGALQARNDTLRRRSQELKATRKGTHHHRRAQIALGKRPPPPSRAGKRQISFVTANASSEKSLRNELLHGTAFAKDQIIMGQELKVPPDGLRDA